jgi:hypothetical protein
MNRVGILVLGTTLAALSCDWGTFSAAAQTATAPAARRHGVLFTKVDKTWDSSKLKEGDTVEVEMASAIKLPDGTVVPKGSKVTGHVTAAKARSKGDQESELTVTFDELNAANGRQLAVEGTLQAVFPPPDERDPRYSSGMINENESGSGGLIGEAKNGASMDSDTKPQFVIDTRSVGAHGIDDLRLHNGVLTSMGKRVKLGDGVRIILRAEFLP